MSKAYQEQQLQRAIEGLLTKRGLAPKLQISERTVSEWMKKGRIPFLKIGKTVRFDLADVLQKLGAHRVN
jgi:excisionase family DNA binding protein